MTHIRLKEEGQPPYVESLPVPGVVQAFAASTLRTQRRRIRVYQRMNSYFTAVSRG